MNKLKIAHLNCRSLPNKFTQIFDFINKEGVDVLSLNETYLTSKHTNQNFINNHRIIRCDRTHSKGGGVAIIIKNNLKFKILQRSSTENHDFVAIEIFDNSHKITFISIYTHPNSNTNFDFLANLATQKKVIITGDFNSLSSDWFCKSTNKRGKILSSLINNNKICILNNDVPTFRKSSNILDLALSSYDLANSINGFKVHTNFTASDHFPISFQIQTDLSRTKIKLINWDCFKENIKNIQPISDPIETIEQIENKIEIFTDSIKKALENASTERTAPNQKINLPGTLLYIIKLKKRLLRKYSRSHNSQIKNLANNLDNKIKRTITSLNNDKWNSVYENITNTNPSERKFWQAINTKNENEIKFLADSDKPKQEKVEILAEHLEKVFSNPHSQHKKTNNYFKYYKSERYNQPISLTELTNSINQTTAKNSSGYDTISNKTIKNLNQTCLIF